MKQIIVAYYNLCPLGSQDMLPQMSKLPSYS